MNTSHPRFAARLQNAGMLSLVLGSTVRDYVKKGSKLYIEGKIQTRFWDDQSSGDKKYRTEILVRQVTLLSANGQQRAEGSSSDPKGGTQKRMLRGSGTQNIENDEYGDIGITDADIPPF